MKDDYEPPGGLPAYDALWEYTDKALVREIEGSPTAMKRLEKILSGEIQRRNSFGIFFRSRRRLDIEAGPPDDVPVTGIGEARTTAQARRFPRGSISSGLARSQDPDAAYDRLAREFAPDLLIEDFYKRWTSGALIAFGEPANGPLSGPLRRQRIGDLAEHLEIVDWSESSASGRGRSIFDLRFHRAENLERWERGLSLLEAVELLDPESWKEFQSFPDRREVSDTDYAWFRDQIIRPNVCRREVTLKTGNVVAGWRAVPDRELASDEWWARLDMARSLLVPPDGDPNQVRVFGRPPESDDPATTHDAEPETLRRQGNAARRPGLKVLVPAAFDDIPAEEKVRLVGLRRKRSGAVLEAAKRIHGDLKSRGYDFALSSVKRALRSEMTRWEAKRAGTESG